MFRLLKSQRGAMFGMDGRITVMIMMALAAIVGLVGTKKLQTAKYSALIKELDALHQAYEGLQADMGVFVRYAIATSNGSNDFIALWDSSVIVAGLQPKWLGPYYSIHSRDHQTYGDFTVDYMQASRIACTDSADCYVWIKLSEVPAAVWDAVNSFVDENNGDSLETSGSKHTLGRVQSNSGAAASRDLYYRSIKRVR